MSLETAYLLYLIVFRLGIITAGTISIILGYKLFTRGLLGTSEKNSLETKVSGARFTLKNAAPGTGFAFFGVILVSVMLFQGNPELTYETLKKVAANENTDSTKIVVRGIDRPDRFAALVQAGIENEKNRNLTAAADAYREALGGLALPMNQLAGVYLQQGKVDDALSLARLAAQLSPTDADVLDTLAEVLATHGDRAEARQWMQKAAALNARYRNKLTDPK